MSRLSSYEDLKELANEIRGDTDLSKPKIVICAGTACQASGANDIIRVAKKYILQKKLLNAIDIKITGCHGFCEMGLFILAEPQGAFYHQVTIDNIGKVIDAVIANTYCEELLYRDPKTHRALRLE